MQSITITATSIPTPNTPTSCSLNITDINGVTRSYGVVVPANMFTVVNNAPDLTPYAQTKNVDVVTSGIKQDLSEFKLRVFEAFATLPKLVDTSNFISKSELLDEATARSTQFKTLFDGLKQYTESTTTNVEAVNTKLTQALETLSGINDTIQKISDRVDKLEEDYKNCLTNTGGVTGISTDGTVVSITTSKNSLGLATSVDLTTAETDLTSKGKNYLDKVKSGISDQITDLTAIIRSGNVALTDTVKVLLKEGVSDNLADITTTSDPKTDSLSVTYNNLNTALLSLRGGGNQISGVIGLSDGDRRGISLYTDKDTNRATYIDVGGVKHTLLYKEDLFNLTK